jgi:mitotic spindle assembly checkpoint protein MAD1
LEERIDELSSRQVAVPRGNNAEDGDWKVVREELSRQAEYLRTLEATNAKMTSELFVLRQRHESLEVLREQKRDLERKLSATDALRQSVITLEAEVEVARREREEWFACCINPIWFFPN